MTVAGSRYIEESFQRAEKQRRKPVLDPTLTYQDFEQTDDHAAWGHLKSRAAWDSYRHSCERLHREDPAAYARAEVVGYEARIAEGLRALRVYVRLFRQTGDRVLYKDNGIDFEKALIRLWTERLAQARANLDALRQTVVGGRR